MPRVTVSLSEFELRRLDAAASFLGVSRSAVLSASWSFSVSMFEQIMDNPAYKSRITVSRRNTADLHNFLLSALLYESSRSAVADPGDLFNDVPGITGDDVQIGSSGG